MESLTTKAVKLPEIINLDGRDNETALTLQDAHGSACAHFF